jgi:hypothetical protein
MHFGEQFSSLVDMVYPYVIRTLQAILAQWSGGVDFLIWQLLAIVLVVVFLAALVLVIVFKRSIISWAGWVLATLTGIYLLHTMVYGMNYYAGPLADDIRMEVAQYTLEELADATTYYRDRANILAEMVNRNGSGDVDFKDFETLAKEAGDGYEKLTYDRSFSVFAGSREPVKKLGLADMYTSMGITGYTFGLTGEAAVNPQIPDVTLPFTMAHEMAHRMCIAPERDANFAAYLACSVHPSVEFEYSGTFMAYIYCYNALSQISTQASAQAAKEINQGVSDLLRRDIAYYNTFFINHRDQAATDFADSVNDTYLKTSGDKAGIASYGQVCDLLVNWHIQEIVLPSITVQEKLFDPYDETQVDLNGIVNAR